MAKKLLWSSIQKCARLKDIELDIEKNRRDNHHEDDHDEDDDKPI